MDILTQFIVSVDENSIETVHRVTDQTYVNKELIYICDKLMFYDKDIESSDNILEPRLPGHKYLYEKTNVNY